MACAQDKASQCQGLTLLGPPFGPSSRSKCRSVRSMSSGPVLSDLPEATRESEPLQIPSHWRLQTHPDSTSGH